MVMDILFYSVFSRCPCLVNGRISPVKISLTPAISSPSSSFSSLDIAFPGLVFLIMLPNRPDLAIYFLYFGCCICFFYCYNHLINFLSSLFISLANLDAYVASATARSSPTSSYLFIASLFFQGYYCLQLLFILLPRFVYYFVCFLHGVYYVPLLYYYVVNESSLFKFLCAIRLLYDQKHPVIFIPNATDQSASSQRAREYNVVLTHAHSNRNYKALVKIRIVLTIRTRFGISLESHSSQHPVSRIPAATGQSDSNRRAPNCNVDLLSNQLDSTQSPGLSKLQVDAASISNSSELKGSEDLTGVNQFASRSSELQTNQLAPPDWAALDHGLISEIILPTDEDFVSFKEVCRWWRFLCAGMNWTTNRQLPCLIPSERLHRNMRSFYSFYNNRHYEIELRAARQSRCFASPHGWIVTLTPHRNIHILNPISQDLKMLPLLRASNNHRSVGDWFQYIHKHMVFKSSPSEFLVMAIYGSRNLLAFDRFGEQKWNTVKDASGIRDVALFGGQFYALRAFGTLVCIEFRGVARPIFIAPPPQDSRIPTEVYLVKSSSSGDLLGVFRFGIELERRRETENFLVYKFDFLGLQFLTIRTRFGISLESHSSQHPVSLIPAATDQSDSNQRAPNCNVDLLSNQLDSTQSPGLSKHRVDAVSILNSSELQGNEDVTGVNQFASRSSELQTNQLAPPDWAALDYGLISEIIDRLPTDEDFLSFKEVCHWWRFLCAGMNWSTNCQLPWLMLSERVHSNMRSFYSFDKNRHYEIELRAARQSRCFASPHGCVVTLTPHGNIYLLNPLSQDLKMLPLLRASINHRAAGDWFQYIHKLMVFKSSPNEFFVMAIYGSRNLLAFVRFGEQKWNTVKDASEIRDVALFGGQFYALRAFGTLVCIEFRRVARAIFIAPPPQDSRIPAEVYLVKSSSGDLWGVFRFGIELERRRETENFLVYKFDFVTEEWESLKDLEQCAVFVGEGNSWCIRATNAKHGNRVYYTDDYWKRQRTGEVTPNGHDIGVFSMESGETEFLNFGTDFPSEFSRPIWITPNSRAKFFPY